jgi:hypothetical protein
LRIDSAKSPKGRPECIVLVSTSTLESTVKVAYKNIKTTKTKNDMLALAPIKCSQ